VRNLIGRGIEVAQWGQSSRATSGPIGPIAVLDVFVKKSASGIATPKTILDRIQARLQRIQEAAIE